MTLTKPEHCDLCLAPPVKGMRMGKGIIWLCEKHHQVMLDSMRTVADAGMGYARAKFEALLMRKPALRAVVNVLSTLRKP